VLSWGNSELVIEAVVPYFLYVFPFFDNTVENGVVEGEDTLLGLSLFSDICFFVAHSDHDVFVFGPADHCWER